MGSIDHFQCILIRRTLYKVVNIVNFMYYGKTRKVSFALGDEDKLDLWQ